MSRLRGNVYASLRVALWLSVSILTFSCGYRLEGARSHKEVATVEVPYIAGDVHGVFTGELIKALSRSGDFRYVSSHGDLQLRVVVSSKGDGTIGWKYNREYPDVFQKRLMAIENRVHVGASFSVTDNHTGKEIIPSTGVSAFEDYDYANTSAYSDETVQTPSGTQAVIAFSLGQLDSPDGASVAVLEPLYRKLADKIVLSLIKKKYPE